MEGGAIVNTAGGEEYPGKLTLFVFLTCVVAATGGLIFGYDIGISGGVTSMDPFLRKFFPSVHRKQKQHQNNNQYCKFNSQLLTTFTSSLYLAALVASFFASSVTRVLGRKWSMFGGGITFLVGAALNGAARNVLMLILGRILVGIGVGFANQSVPIYLSEMAPARLRGKLNVSFHLMIAVGILCANIINYGTNKIQGGWGWRVSLALAAVPAAIITVGSLFLPDTPHSLIGRKRGIEARRAPMAQHRQAQVPRAAHHGHSHPVLPAAYWPQCDWVLRTSALQDPRVRRARVARVGCDHGAGERARDVRLCRGRRQARSTQAPLAGRLADAHVPDTGIDLLDRKDFEILGGRDEN